MDHFVSAVLIAISSNVDNLGVGVAYGLRGRGFRPAHTLWIALVPGLATLVSMAAGEWANRFMSEPRANLIGSGLILAIGVSAIAQALRDAGNGAPQIERGTTTSSEATVLAVSLSLDNLGSGLGAGISHVSIPATTALTILGGVAALLVGHRIGKHASSALSKRSLGVTAGLILVAVGIYEFFV